MLDGFKKYERVIMTEPVKFLLDPEIPAGTKAMILDCSESNYGKSFEVELFPEGCVCSLTGVNVLFGIA